MNRCNRRKWQMNAMSFVFYARTRSKDEDFCSFDSGFTFTRWEH